MRDTSLVIGMPLGYAEKPDHRVGSWDRLKDAEH
jgi:hypothetical protein